MSEGHPDDIFFFSSRRRHTRLQGDWSSDVCSSDLRQVGGGRLARHVRIGREHDLLHAVPLDAAEQLVDAQIDRKSTRLNSSHLVISYAVFCLKKKKKKKSRRNVCVFMCNMRPRCSP